MIGPVIMRPRRVIGLFCAEPTERAALAFTLDTLGFRVLQGATLAAFAAAVGVCAPDCFLVVHDSLWPASANAIGAWLGSRYPRTPVVAVVPEGYRVSRYITTCQVDADAGMSMVLEAVRIACSRKRGRHKCDADFAEAAQ